MLLKIDKKGKLPIFKQIAIQIKRLIDQGVIEVNKPLPSTRSLAEKLGINRSTISKAYEELQVLGYLKSRPGSYNIVQKRRKEVDYDSRRKSSIPWKDVVNETAENLFEIFSASKADVTSRTSHIKSSIINLSELQLDPRLFPVNDFRRCVNRVLLNNGAEALDYCPSEGNRDLREYIAQRLRLHGISTSVDEILITYGSQQALDLIIRLFARPDRKVALEAPTYFNIIPLLKFNKVKILGIPLHSDGMDLDYLERVLNEEEVSFVYTIPNFHNPTGITTSHHHREMLLNICLHHKVPILEDGFEEEMKYFGTVPLPIKSIDEHNIVIYVGTFSKIVFPGVRIGWITADKGCINRLAAIRRSSDLRCGNMMQAALHHFCSEGYYDMHLKRLHRVFRKRMEVALETMEKYFPKSTSWTRPQGGYTIWVKSPKKLNASQLYDFMSQHGVIVSPGGYYFPEQSASEYFRLSISRIDEKEIREGLKRLGTALEELSWGL